MLSKNFIYSLLLLCMYPFASQAVVTNSMHSAHYICGNPIGTSGQGRLLGATLAVGHSYQSASARVMVADFTPKPTPATSELLPLSLLSGEESMMTNQPQLIDSILSRRNSGWGRTSTLSSAQRLAQPHFRADHLSVVLSSEAAKKALLPFRGSSVIPEVARQIREGFQMGGFFLFPKFVMAAKPETFSAQVFVRGQWPELAIKNLNTLKAPEGFTSPFSAENVYDIACKRVGPDEAEAFVRETERVYESDRPAPKLDEDDSETYPVPTYRSRTVLTELASYLANEELAFHSQGRLLSAGAAVAASAVALRVLTKRTGLVAAMIPPGLLDMFLANGIESIEVSPFNTATLNKVVDISTSRDIEASLERELERDPEFTDKMERLLEEVRSQYWRTRL